MRSFAVLPKKKSFSLRWYVFKNFAHVDNIRTPHSHISRAHLCIWGLSRAKSWTKVPLDYYNMPIARTGFRNICISSHSSGTTFANTYFRNKGVFNRSTKVISSKCYPQFPVGNTVLQACQTCGPRAACGPLQAHLRPAQRIL